MSPEGVLLPGADDLARRFIDGELTKPEWTHAAHLAVGLWHVHHHGAAGALPLLRARIRALNERHGTANTATSGYHETITAAYVELLSQFLSTCHPRDAIDDAVVRLLSGPLARRDALFAYYTRDRLASAEARAALVDPDVRPLTLSAL